MSYTMHSPSQGYTNTSADVYGSRAYAGHLMTQNYSNYLNPREDPYSGNVVPYSSGPLQSAHYPANSSMSPHHTYPTLPPISHFPHQQDLYSSCGAPSRNQHSYTSTPTPAGATLASGPRHSMAKAYWNCESIQQSSSHCYPSTNSTHKTSPQAWSHSSNVMSSPSSTPSPIPGPSTPHLFASSPHHGQSIAESHKPYNGILPNSSLSTNSGANLTCNNPLQSLQKMVQIESESTDIRVQYESSPVQSAAPIGSVSQHQSAQSNAQLSGLDSEGANYPTYYNLDQNRLCATPQATYSNIPTSQINSAPFSPTLKSSQEIRPQPIQISCSSSQKTENCPENGGDLAANKSSAMRFSNKLSKENSFLANRSCSTDTCSNGSPAAQPIKVSSVSDPALQTEQTHDSVNSFRGSETTANSRDSAKSTDSDAMSSYATSQCPPTPNNTAWNKSTDFRQTSFASSSQGKAWWPENSISPSASRSFTPHIADCAQQYNGAAVGVSFASSQVAHQMPATNSPGSTLPPGQSWSQQSTSSAPAASTAPQMLPTAAYPGEGSVVKKKRGRPFGSKNRRNVESGECTAKRKRKTVGLVDIGVNTSLSFDVQSSLNLDDSWASSQQQQPLAGKRKKAVGAQGLGPVVRIDNTMAHNCPTKYSIVNTKQTEEDSKGRMPAAKTGLDLSSQSKKNGFAKRTTVAAGMTALSEKNWMCVLCHKGPHYKGLGDLYGPYCIVLDKCKLSSALDQILDTHEEAEAEHNVSERRSLRRRADSGAGIPAEDSKGKSPSVPHHPSSTPTPNQEDGKELKMNMDVWIHEDCIVWSNNVYLDGTKIRNLEPAIVESFNNICTKCKLPGATLGCIFKNCTVSPLHYLCAKDKDCDLDEEKFILSCSKHKKRRISPKELEVVEVSEASTTTATNES